MLEAIHRDVTYTPPVWLPPAEHEEFRPLPRAKTNLDAYNYLVQERGLDQELVDGLMRQGRIYQSGKYKNVVFVGTDFDGQQLRPQLRSHAAGTALRRPRLPEGVPLSHGEP